MTSSTLLSLVLMLAAFVARRTEGSWASPAAFFTALWGGFLLVASAIFYEVPELGAGAIWIVLICLGFYAGTLLAHGFEIPRSRVPLTESAARGRLPWLRGPVICGLVGGLLEIGFIFARRDFSLVDVLSYAVISQVVIANRSDLYAGVSDQARIEWFVFWLLYAGSLFGGILFRLRRSRAEGALAVLTFLMVAAVHALYGSRFGALFGGAFWVASYLATSIAVGKEDSVFGTKFLFRVGLASAVVLFGFSVLTQIVRYGPKLGAVGWRAVLGDGFSFPAALGLWVAERGPVLSHFDLGARTFTRIAGLVGIAESPLPAIDVGFTSSNIYTVFRDLIQDFGSVGAVTLAGVAGFVGHLVYQRVRAGAVGMIPVMALWFGFMLTSFAVSLFFYTAPMMAMFAFLLYGGISQWLMRLPQPAGDRGVAGSRP